MLLAIGNRQATRDIDAYFATNPQIIRDAAHVIAQREGLPPDWINDGVKGFFSYVWQRQTIAETFERIQQQPKEPWVAIGDFIDDWRRSDREDRLELVTTSIAEPQKDGQMHQWAAFCAALVEWLCWQDELPFPSWTNSEDFRLREPWFLYPGDLLRAWQLATTPAPFKARNIFGGEQIVSRV
jgi:hypothetical protein